MKILLISFGSFLLASMSTNSSSCNPPIADAGLIPLEVGSQWVYEDSVFSKGHIYQVKKDTEMITSKGDFEGKATYIFNTGKEWFESGDTIFQLYPQRTGVKTATPVFIAGEKISFITLFGGDVVVEKTGGKMTGGYLWKGKTVDAFECHDGCGAMLLVVPGVGVVREIEKHCFNEIDQYTTRTLISAGK